MREQDLIHDRKVSSVIKMCGMHRLIWDDTLGSCIKPLFLEAYIIKDQNCCDSAQIPSCLLSVPVHYRPLIVYEILWYKQNVVQLNLRYGFVCFIPNCITISHKFGYKYAFQSMCYYTFYIRYDNNSTYNVYA